MLARTQMLRVSMLDSESKFWYREPCIPVTTLLLAGVTLSKLLKFSRLPV